MARTATINGLILGIFLSFYGILVDPAQAVDYFVRPDGGTATQCTGLHDAPYPGSGLQRDCAWAHPYWAILGTDPPQWRLTGGDTLVISSGSYRMGLGAPNTSWCSSEYPYDCHLPPLPSGPDSQHPTRILGKGWDQGCAQPPQLWGTERIWRILDLSGSSNAVVACLELTDHSSCVEFHAAPEARCQRDSFPYGDWAQVGIYAEDSSDVVLQDLDIHGLASAGIKAGRISQWTVDRVRIAGNGWVGWEGDLGGSSSNSGALIFRHWLVEWNGCAETYPEKEPAHCWAQAAGGYGDGIGTGATGGQWIIEDSTFRYNTSDGLDLLYVREPGSSIEIRRSQAYGNAGNQIKTSGPTRIENTLMVSNCGFFHGKPFAPLIDSQDPITHCRAGGGAWDFTMRQGNLLSMVNSTIVGEGDCLLAGACDWDRSQCNGTETILLYNNIFRGYPEFMSDGDQACYLWMDRSDLYPLSWDYNIVFDAKLSNLLPPLGPDDMTGDPLFLSSSLADFDGHLQAQSPAIDSGLLPGSLSELIPDHDLEGISRPRGSGSDRGAFEYVTEGPIEAAFTANPLAGNAPATIQLQDQSTGTITTWSWDFGDGDNSSLQNPTHTYSQAGLYTITLIISGPDGDDSLTKPDYIRVYACGDLDRNGQVDETDRQIKTFQLIANFRMWVNVCFAADLSCGDHNGDGFVNYRDLVSKLEELRDHYVSWLNDCWL